jgi:hypothetical protein
MLVGQLKSSYVNKAGHVYITFHTGLGGKYNHLCSFK